MQRANICRAYTSHYQVMTSLLCVINEQIKYLYHIDYMSFPNGYFRTGISERVFPNNPFGQWDSVLYVPANVCIWYYTTEIYSRYLKWNSSEVTDINLLLLTYYSRFRTTDVMHPKIGWIQEIIDQPDYIMMNWGGFNRFGICQFEIERGMD